MIHSKSLIRRLAYVPWLLAFGLVLGWAGEAQAQTITLTLDPSSVREDSETTTITIKATIDAAQSTATHVITSIAQNAQLGRRFTVGQMPLITIPADKTEQTGTFEFTALSKQDDPDADPPVTNLDEDLEITVNGTSSVTVASGPTLTMTDAHTESDQIILSFDPANLSEEEGSKEVTVTATLAHRVQAKAINFRLVVTTPPTNDTSPADKDVARRDVDYVATMATLIIPKRKVSGTATIIIDPRARERDDPVNNVNISGVFLGIGSSDNTDGSTGQMVEGNDDTPVVQVAGYEIKDTPIAALKPLTATPSEVREEGGAVEIELKVTLQEALPDPAEVFFTIIDTGDDDELNDDAATESDLEKFFADTEPAERDVNYTASFTDLTIPALATEGTATLTFTPIDNDDREASKGLRVIATVANGETSTAGVKIHDDETPTTVVALKAEPAEVTSGAGPTEVTITGTINGGVFEEDVDVVLVLNPGTADAAQRDTDYTATLRSLSISAGETSGSTTIEITATNGAAKKIEVRALKNTDLIKNDDDDPVTSTPAVITLKAAPDDAVVDPTVLAFDTDVDIGATVFGFVVGEERDEPIQLPDVKGGAEGDRTYVTSALPAGLVFDADELTISGVATAVTEETPVIYTVVDSEGASVATTVTIEVNAAPPPTTSVESVSATQMSIRENGETTVITITATLAEEAPTAETISFTIGNSTGGGTPAVRDVDYTALLLGSVAIEAGATQATSTLTLTPINNNEEDGNRSFGVHAAGSGGSASVDITIADDETASTSISLSVSPNTVAEGDDATALTITATLDGKVLDADAVVTVSVDPASEADRDVDYRMLFSPTITIVAGAISGSVDGLIEPLADDLDEDSESITLNGAIEGLVDGTGTLIITDVAMMDPEEEMMDPLVFAEGMMIDDVGVTQGSPMSAEVLPEASGGEGDIAYSVSELPAGLAFAADTRTLSGSAEAEGTTEVTYTATAGDESVTLTFTITVNPPLTFGDFLGLFTNGAGKANPADSHVDGDGVLQIVVGQPYNLTLPAVEGGTPPYTYELIGLPAGLSFDQATRTVSGTPTELADTFAITYKVTDGSGASRSLPILAAVVAPPLDAPDALEAEDYKGADGAGDQGGFVLLTWDLSEHHDGIDGYRIFRELPVLGNEMVPWAMVDAVPGVERGRAIVATLDNVATNWGIAAERGGQTTHGAAKAVFVNAENPYELMAETMTASRDAAQAGDAPVFASLLPEALAHAQGVAPKLNLVAGVLSSAITLTEEPVRATDDIAPLAVPSLIVLDAPNDAGSRILLTWTLSPSDQLLQGVIAEAFGPTALEQVVGVHGYGIYRRAASEDEFALVAQVDAGVASFVDETALNGVRYTYQVRPYDLDNETGSDIEQTAMAVRNSVLDSEGRALFGLFGADNRIGFDDFFIFADSFGLTEEDAGFDPAFDLAPNAMIDFEDFFVFADNFGRSTAGAGKRVPMLAGLNADARMYLDARTAMPIVGEDFVLDVRMADFAAIKGYGLQVQYEADKLEFVEVLTDQPLGGRELATPQVLADQAGVLTVAAHGDLVSDGEVPLSLVFRAITEIENTVVEITDNQTYDSEFGFNRLALPAPVQLQTRPEAFALANNYPNPFNPATTIKYALPQAADVELTVYNVVGQPVRTLVAEHQNAGRYVVEWDATNNNGHSLASGMYFYRLQAGGEFLEIKKMLLLK